MAKKAAAGGKKAPVKVQPVYDSDTPAGKPMASAAQQLRALVEQFHPAILVRELALVCREQEMDCRAQEGLMDLSYRWGRAATHLEEAGKEWQ